MKTHIIILLLLTQIGCKSQENSKNDLDQLNLKGNIKSITETFSSKSKLFAVPNEGFKSTLDFRLNKIVKFNKHGNIIEEKHFSPDSLHSQNFSYNYNNNNKLVEVQIMADFPMADRITYEYNESSKLVKEKYIGATTVCYSTKIYKYNSSGYISEQTSKGMNEIFESKLIYEYDSNRRIINKTWYDENNNIIQKYSYKYEDGVLKKMFYDSTELHKSTENYEYDTYENVIDYKKFNSKNELTKHIEYKYLYDNQNNWIKKEVVQLNGLYYTVYRKIEYN
jgi:hypothetical protein